GVGPIERVDRAVEEREREGLAEGFEAGRVAIAPELGERRMRREGRAARALAERGAEVPVLPRRTRDEGGADERGERGLGLDTEGRADRRDEGGECAESLGRDRERLLVRDEGARGLREL